MKVAEFLTPFLGTRKGVNKLRLMPTDEYRSSAATASVNRAAGDYVTVAYTWEEGGKPQNGLLLIGGTTKETPAVWVDSWHSAETWLNLSGSVDGEVLKLVGSYPAPSGPDWGWEIHINPSSSTMTMYNVHPEAGAYECVQAIYS